MAFHGIALTADGQSVITGAVTGTAANFTHIAIGDGTFTGDFSTRTALVNEVMRIEVAGVRKTGDTVYVLANFKSSDAPSAFYLRELGIIGNNKLCYYDNAGSDAQYIDPNEDRATQNKRLQFVFTVSDEADVTVVTEENLYVTLDDFEDLASDVSSMESDISAKANQTTIAPVEDGTTSSASYAIGDFIYRLGVLYSVKAAIAQGDSFVENTNIETTTIKALLAGKQNTLTLPLSAANGGTGQNNDKDASEAFYATAHCKTAAGTAAKTAAMANFQLITGVDFWLYLDTANTAASPTLSVNGTTAKPVYVNGSAATVSNLTAGWWHVMYDGAYYQFRNTGAQTVPVAAGGTGATTAAGARSNLGLGTAAEKNSTNTVTEDGTGLPTAGAVFSYVQQNGGGSFNVNVQVETSYAGETVTLSDGSHTYTGTISAAGTATINVKHPGTYTGTINGTGIGSADVGVYTIGGKPTKIYGFHLDATKSDPAQMISYEVQYNSRNVDNYSYTPCQMNLSTGVMDPGSWNLTDDFFIPRSCMLKYDCTVDYYLDENDETKKEDGTASDVANTSYGGNAMMEWGRDGQKIYMKIVPDSTPTNGATYYFSNKKLDSDFTSWPFYDCDGNEIDHFYTPKYCGSVISSKLRSISGQAPCNNQQGSTEVTYANANNVNSKVEWDTEVLADRQLINGLLLLIGKNCNTQAVFGQGYTTGGSSASSLANSGTLNGKGQWCGYSTNNDKTKGVKVFGMEHWWGNVFRRIRGYLNMSGTVKYKMTYSQVDGTTQTGYDTTGSGYKTVASGTPGGTNGGYVNVAVFNEEGFYPKTASGSETTYFADGLYFNNIQANYAFVGGACYAGALCGALCVALDSTFSVAAWSLGAALSCKPLAA